MREPRTEKHADLNAYRFLPRHNILNNTDLAEHFVPVSLCHTAVDHQWALERRRCVLDAAAFCGLTSSVICFNDRLHVVT